MKGWYGDKQAHSLASKGIKTKIANEETFYMLGYITPKQWVGAIQVARDDRDYMEEKKLWDMIDELDDRWGGVKEEVKEVLLDSKGYTRDQYRMKYEETPTSKLVIMAENLEDMVMSGRHPISLKTKEEKERYEDNVNSLNAMTFELEKRGVNF